jgi:hypothetical protein
VSEAVPNAGAAASDRPAFSPRTILALVLVGVVSFAGLAVLAAYAPEWRGAADPGAHALSSSAVGYKGALVMLKAEGGSAAVSRVTPGLRGPVVRDLMVLTPTPDSRPADVIKFAYEPRLLIVLPKWATQPHPMHLGWVQKIGAETLGVVVTPMLTPWSKKTLLDLRKGADRPKLYGAGGPFQAGTYLPLGSIDRLQTISGDGWAPALVDEQGHMVLAYAKLRPDVLVLADPDLLNNQGLAKLDNARAGMAILNTLRGDHGVTFDVTLTGFGRGRSIGRTMLEPPWLAATLCGVAAAVLMGLHALARFGPVARRDRAIALGKRALVDNSAGLIRMARREAELAPAYATLTRTLAGRAAGVARGADPDRWLADLARRREAAAPEDLNAEAERARTRDDLLAIGRKLYSWRLEITRERR